MLFLFIYFYYHQAKVQKILSRFREQSKQIFLTDALHHFGILECFS